MDKNRTLELIEINSYDNTIDLKQLIRDLAIDGTVNLDELRNIIEDVDVELNELSKSISNINS